MLENMCLAIWHIVYSYIRHTLYNHNINTIWAIYTCVYACIDDDE